MRERIAKRVDYGPENRSGEDEEEFGGDYREVYAVGGLKVQFKVES